MGKNLLTALLLTTAMAGCGAPAALAPAAIKPQAQTLSLRLDKADAATKQVSTSKLAAKQGADLAKTPTYTVRTNAVVTEDMGNGELTSLASMTLVNMQRASSYEAACQIGYPAVDRLNTATGYNNVPLRFGFYGAKACTKWKNAYAVLTMALGHIVDHQPATGLAVYALAQRQMAATDSYEDGARAGYEMLETIGKADANPANRRLAEITYQSAKAASRWDDAYTTIQNGLRRMN